MDPRFMPPGGPPRPPMPPTLVDQWRAAQIAQAQASHDLAIQTAILVSQAQAQSTRSILATQAQGLLNQAVQLLNPAQVQGQSPIPPDGVAATQLLQQVQGLINQMAQS